VSVSAPAVVVKLEAALPVISTVPPASPLQPVHLRSPRMRPPLGALAHLALVPVVTSRCELVMAAQIPTMTGDLFLQGGRQNGTGAPGSVILKPQVDSADAFQMQDTAGSTFFTADTASHTITIKGTDTSFASLTVTDAHVKSTQTTPPTIGTPAACGTTPVAAVTAGSTDTAGSFTITTGTGGTSATCDAVVTFHQPYGAAPKSIIVVGKTDAASAARQIYVSAVNATTFTVSFGASAAGANSTPYSFSYWVIE